MHGTGFGCAAFDVTYKAQDSLNLNISAFRGRKGPTKHEALCAHSQVLAKIAAGLQSIKERKLEAKAHAGDSGCKAALVAPVCSLVFPAGYDSSSKSSHCSVQDQSCAYQTCNVVLSPFQSCRKLNIGLRCLISRSSLQGFKEVCTPDIRR